MIFLRTALFSLLILAITDTFAQGIDPALREAVIAGDVKTVQTLLDKVTDVDAFQAGDRALLMDAAYYGHLEIVKLLLEKGAKVNAAMNDGWTALMSACKGGHLDVVQLLIDKGADIYVKKRDQSASPIFLAAELGYTEIVKLLIEKGAAWDEKHVPGGTALTIAVKNGHVDTVKYLLEAGANVDAQNSNGENPYLIAFKNGNRELMSELLAHGANASEEDKNGISVLNATIAKKDLKGLKLLLLHGGEVNATNRRGQSLLMAAIQAGSEEMTAELLAKGADVNAVDRGGNTPLAYAEASKNANLGPMLLHYDLDLKKKENSTKKILWHAISKGHTQLVTMLLDNGATPDISADDDDNWFLSQFKPTTLMIAAGSDAADPDLVELLINRGMRSKINQTDKFGATALHYALGLHDLQYRPSLKDGKMAKTVKILIQHGADVNKKNNMGVTPLMVINRHSYGRESTKAIIVNLLKDAGAYEDNSLHLAIENNDFTATTLILNGANLQFADNAGWTPLMIAAKKGKLEIVNLLLNLLVTGRDVKTYVNQKNHEGKTALMMADQIPDLSTREAIIKRLRKAGAKE